jgi:hypothetical protein
VPPRPHHVLTDGRGRQTNRKLMREEYENTEDVNAQLAAYRLQVKHGDYDEKKQRISTEDDLKHVLPAGTRHSRDLEDWAKLINFYYQRLVGKTKFRMCHVAWRAGAWVGASVSDPGRARACVRVPMVCRGHAGLSGGCQGPYASAEHAVLPSAGACGHDHYTMHACADRSLRARGRSTARGRCS